MIGENGKINLFSFSTSSNSLSHISSISNPTTTDSSIPSSNQRDQGKNERIMRDDPSNLSFSMDYDYEDQDYNSKSPFDATSKQQQQSLMSIVSSSSPINTPIFLPSNPNIFFCPIIPVPNASLKGRHGSQSPSFRSSSHNNIQSFIQSGKHFGGVVKKYRLGDDIC